MSLYRISISVLYHIGRIIATVLTGWEKPVTIYPSDLSPFLYQTVLWVGAALKKFRFPSELAYAAGLTILALGTALMERSDLGVSMVVAPAYLIYLKLSASLPFFTFGMSEYLFQAFLLVVLALIMGRFRLSCLFSFVTAVIYGILLDLMMRLVSGAASDTMLQRMICFASGTVICAVGITLLFKTYFIPEAYEFFVKELAAKTGRQIGLVKTVYDISSLLLGVMLSFLFFGFMRFEGVKIGTLVCALVNGPLISLFSRLADRRIGFYDALPLRGFFEGAK